MKRWTQAQQQWAKPGAEEDFRTNQIEVVVVPLLAQGEDEASLHEVEVDNIRPGAKVHFALAVTICLSNLGPQFISDTLLVTVQGKLLQ